MWNNTQTNGLHHCWLSFAVWSSVSGQVEHTIYDTNKTDVTNIADRGSRYEININKATSLINYVNKKEKRARELQLKPTLF